MRKQKIKKLCGKGLQRYCPNHKTQKLCCQHKEVYICLTTIKGLKNA